MAPRAVHALEFRAGRQELPQEPRALALHLRHEEVQECAPLRPELPQLRQHFQVEAVGAPARCAAVEVVPHLKNEAEQPLHARRAPQPLRGGAHLGLSGDEALQRSLKGVQEGPQPDAQLVVGDRHEREHEALGLVPGVYLGPLGGLTQHRLLLRCGQVGEQDLDFVGLEHLVVHGLNGPQDDALLGHEGVHEPDLPPPALVEETPSLRPLCRRPAARRGLGQAGDCFGK
mmetsp:Transcript_84619/g.262842  ORF Transcript_84619/g.262842 Transcript_84619/m.262842 type:complete len:230 (+) Transcript_84619:526-1215(+)